MNFGQAIEAIKGGGRARRACWFDGVWMSMVDVDKWPKDTAPAGTSFSPIAVSEWGDPFLAVEIPSVGLKPWLVTQSDVLAEDWEIAQ